MANMVFRASGLVTMAGTSEVLLALNSARQYLYIQNTGTANLTVNMIGGAAVPGAQGCITLTPITVTGPNNFVVYEGEAVPGNAINVIGTAAQPCLCLYA